MIVNKNSIRFFRLLSDLLLLNLSFILAAWQAQSLEILFQRNYMFILLLVLNIFWYYTTRLSGFYDDFNVRYFAYQFINIIKSIFWQVIAAIIFIFLVKEDLFTRNFIFYYSALILLFISLRTLAFKLLLKYLRKKGLNVRNLIIIGEGETGGNFINLIKEHPDFGYNFIGFVGTAAGNDKSSGIIGSVTGLEDIITSNKIDEAVIALNESNSSVLDNVIKICNRQAVKIHIIPDYFRFLSKKFGISMIGNYPVISVRKEPLDEAGWRLIKRTFDLLFSIITSVLLLSWLIPLIAILIKQIQGGKYFTSRRESEKKIKELKFINSGH
jgi:putative colanic acid biosysnthesis UDP-glucose lipid carrier transferase